jgi:hypothetical protein
MAAAALNLAMELLEELAGAVVMRPMPVEAAAAAMVETPPAEPFSVRDH